ncbi:PREDICTED: FYVE, RhoGEF and PH domain-containing protein 1-like [Priapulus caudatus]|uniref:FYVE, RhoGEF and PH domain-containing protein 1-like n=1 Tax=Priapulus caudatus TaxID=37621 RepID=A0ABM1FAN2_PRICU|nr:PREDICTED: FYVE, RhoGEF and PH domain-containing protein 1-like [Priapulus caudatus]
MARKIGVYWVFTNIYVDDLRAIGTPIILEGTADDEKKKYHLYRIALEILTTERTYVDKLNLIDQVLHARLDAANERHNMFPDDVTKRMFSNMKSVYQLHHDFVLPQLEQRMQEWEKVKRIGDIMLRFAPFLKMYTEYVNNYEMAQKLINIWLVKSNRFRAIVDELSKLPECDNMLILNHMLVPVQRVPRYELLLKEYLKRLPGDSADRADAEKALTCVSAAAHHINNAMRKIHKFKKLLEIRDLLGGAVDLVSPSREFIKEGRLVKISARSGDHQERYLFLDG